jgi:hypothetical protein
MPVRAVCLRRLTIRLPTGCLVEQPVSTCAFAGSLCSLLTTPISISTHTGCMAYQAQTWVMDRADLQLWHDTICVVMSNRDKRQPPQSATPSADSTRREVYLEAGSKIDFSDAVKQARENERRDDAKTDKRNFVLTSITTGLLFLTAGFSLLQSVSSKISADAAKRAAEIAQQTLEQSNRAWLKPSLTKPEAKSKPEETTAWWETHHNVTAHYTFENIGKTPITDTELQIVHEIPRTNEGPSMTSREPYRHGKATIVYPGETFDVEAEFSGAPDAKPGTQRALTPELKQELLSFQRYIVAYGQATYHDPLGEHWIRFCYWTTLGVPTIEQGLFASGDCPAYNSTGDGPLPN